MAKPNPRRLFSTNAMARRKGMPLGVMRGLAERGEISSYQIGGQKFLDEAEVDAYFVQRGLAPGEFQIVSGHHDRRANFLRQACERSAFRLHQYGQRDSSFARH